MKRIFVTLLAALTLSSSLCLYSCNEKEERKDIGDDSTTENVQTENTDNATDSVIEEFVVGDGIKINMTETTTDFIVEPGAVIKKDSKVTVEDNADGCWLFVKVESTLPEYVNYVIDSAWTAVPDYEGVYFIEEAAETDYAVLADNQLTVDADVSDVSDADNAKLSFTAYAIELDASDNPTEAYEAILAEIG